VARGGSLIRPIREAGHSPAGSAPYHGSDGVRPARESACAAGNRAVPDGHREVMCMQL